MMMKKDVTTSPAQQLRWARATDVRATTDMAATSWLTRDEM